MAEEVKQETPEEEKQPSKAALAWKAILRFFKKLWQTVFLPALKNCISEGVNRTTQHILYHTPIDATPNMPNNGSRPAPNGAPWQPSNRPVQGRSACWKEYEPNRFGIQQVCSTDRRALEAIYSKMQARIAHPNSGHTVSVGEMYGYADLPANFPDYQDGWMDLNGCHIQFDPQMNAFVLMMTETMKL